ncbi:MFS general substrate transporter [Cucurbitaria berberidis CBS 394.84]|uniref:MFS general substrate transporter n=1 Tax=Cucurbitaria berberidis CBS 394.84 TaxID=1168544 RepID=A0A9P4GEW5_9PLEO|nr:MFS general substrate transporter [Cucurbitaria berberidis CBS 394.84]KAF1843925.1 MFS general substrate transporter [Cucurbitaria berberidis CBS 394.84]
MSSQPFEKESRKGSAGTLPLSETTTETGSMRTLSTPISLEADDEPDWPQSWRAYACLLGCFFLMFNSWGLVNAYGTWSSYYVGNSLRGVDQLELNLIGSTQSFLVLLFSNPVGRLLDAGYSRVVIGCGTLLVPFGLFILSVVHPSNVGAIASFGPIWATQGLVVGLGMGTFFVSSSQVATTWFPKRRGLAVGYVACGASVAGVVYPTMLRYLIDSLGFNDAVRCVAGLTSITCIYSFIFCTPDPAHDHHEPKRWRALRTWFDTEAFHNKAWCWFTAAVAFMFFGFYPIFFNLEEWASVRGFGTRKTSGGDASNGPLQTFWLLAIMNGASTVGRMLLAHFSDKVGALNMHIVSQFVSSLLTLILWTLAGSETDAIAFCVVFGVFSGMVIGLPPASVGNILNCTYTTADTRHLAKKKLGHWTGMMYTFAAIPALTGPVISGHLITKYNTYITVQMWSGTNLMLSFACMLVARWYLPCANGQSAPSEIARVFGKHEAPVTEKGKGNEIDTGSPEALSQAPTRVPSITPSRQASMDRPDSPERMV